MVILEFSSYRREFGISDEVSTEPSFFLFFFATDMKNLELVELSVSLQGFNSGAMMGFFLFATASRLSLSPVQWVPENVSRG